MLSKSRDALIIHLFALLHAGLAFGCRALGLTDEIVLTLLTMLLVVIICLRRGMSAKFMAISLILVNIIGFHHDRDRRLGHLHDCGAAVA